MHQPTSTQKTSRSHRVIAVADWNLDPHAVLAAMLAHDRSRSSIYGLVVPAGLHGLDWAGEPSASRPCAERQLAELTMLVGNAGVSVEMGRVGDPIAAAAIGDAVYDWPADEILLLSQQRKLALPHPLSLSRRVERTTGLGVTKVLVAARDARRRRFRSAPQCQPLRIGAVRR